MLGESTGRSPSAVPTLRDHLFSTPRFAPALSLRVKEAVAFLEAASSGDLISGYPLQKEPSPRNMDEDPTEV